MASDAGRNPEAAVGSRSHDRWLALGEMQFDYLAGHGLGPGHRMLDIGCGNLRAGWRFIAYLDTGNYYGIDISPDILISAKQTLTTYELQDIGLALGDRERGVKRTIVATIGDGSFQYSIQAIWTAAQHKLPIVFVVLRNEAYEVLKSFALLEQTPHVPALDLPGLDIASLATGFGCNTADVKTTDELANEFKLALDADGPTVIVVQTQAELPHLG